MKGLIDPAPAIPLGQHAGGDACRREPPTIGGLAVRFGALLLVELCFGLAARALVGVS